MLSASPPPPPAPQPHVAPSSQHGALEPDSRMTGLGNDGSNSTTPRGSMENLPPPPPDLLNSDDDEIPRPPSQQKDHRTLIAKRGISVAESVKALQKQGHTPCSPKALRRAHSMAVPPSSVSVNQARPVPKTSFSGVSSQNQPQHPAILSTKNPNAGLYNRQLSQPVPQSHSQHPSMHPQQQPIMQQNQMFNQVSARSNNKNKKKSR